MATPRGAAPDHLGRLFLVGLLLGLIPMALRFLSVSWTPFCFRYCQVAPAEIATQQLVFQTPNQSVPALRHDTCNTVELNTIGLQGDFRTRGGVYVMDDQFKQLFEQIIGGAMFAPATPDHLTLSVMRLYTAAQTTTTFTDLAMMQRLYQAAFSLPPAQPQPDCPPNADKVAGKGTWYAFTFSQWGLPILRLEAYEGSCTRVELSYTQQVMRGNQAFWNLVHQAAALG